MDGKKRGSQPRRTPSGRLISERLYAAHALRKACRLVVTTVGVNGEPAGVMEAQVVFDVPSTGLAPTSRKEAGTARIAMPATRHRIESPPKIMTET